MPAALKMAECKSTFNDFTCVDDSSNIYVKEKASYDKMLYFRNLLCTPTPCHIGRVLADELENLARL